MEEVNIKGINVTDNWNCTEKYEEAGDTNVCRHLEVSDISTVKYNIATSLADEGYTDVQDVFEHEKTEGDIVTLTGMFDLTAK